MSDPHRDLAAASDPLAARKAAAEARVKEALDYIQEAQMLLGHACAALCSVQGMAFEWRKLGSRYDQVHRAWYAVERRAAALRAHRRLVIDHELGTHERGLTRESL